MKNKLKILIPVIMITALSLIGCENNNDKISNKDIKDNSQSETYDLIKYKGSYVGNNSAVGNIISNLPANEYIDGFSLQTNKEPYRITINYKENQNLGSKNYNEFWKNKNIDEFLEKNAVVLLSLIQNTDIIELNIDNMGEKSYIYDRTELEQKYDGNLNDLFKDNTSLNKFLNN